MGTKDDTYIVLTGLSHHTAPLALRERMAITPECMPEALDALRRHLGSESGVAILSTCNRVEVYVCARMAPKDLFQKTRAFLSSFHGVEECEFAEFLYHCSGADAVDHLFKVASSLDSMVVGENEIMCQVQQSYEAARRADTLNRVLHTLFQRALKCGKRVRTETLIGTGSVSVASLAVELAASVLKDFENKTVMIVGSGRISELALKSILDRGTKQVMVLNRTLDNARALAARYRGEALILKALPCHLHRADIVISSTGASEPVLLASDFRRAIEKRGGQPMFVIDAAVPRDIDREVSQINNVYCYDLDDLQGSSSLNLRKRQSEICVCEDIVQAEVAGFLDWQERLTVEPLIKLLTKHYHGIREQELQRTLNKLNGVGDRVRHEVDCLSRRIINNLLQNQIAAIKAGAGRDDAAMYAEWVQNFIGVDFSGEE